jgi:uncharacterized protein YraI
MIYMKVRVTTNYLNVRKGPGTQYDVIGTLANGDVADTVDTTGWLPILLADNSIGWVSEKFVTDASINIVKDICDECDRQGLPLVTQKAYVLATVEWETDGTFKPIREAPSKSEEWRRQNLRYWPYYGRGYVQLTWKSNYETYSKILNLDLVNNPDLSLDPKVALFILVHGFKNGTFTGRRLEEFVNLNKTDFVNARRVVNALDRAETIAGLARKWLARLTSGREQKV